jgi:STE24 endopeptidase
LLIVEEAISIPLSIYSTFVIEERHGFNKTTTKIFLTDISKSLLISATISSAIYATVIYIVVNLGDNWWIYAFGAVFTLQAIIFFLYPVLIMPLFNKFEPLDDEAFKQPIEKLLEKIDFKSKGLFVMNASLRSTHGNAFFTGFGKNKRIVFFDTLLKTITPDEMEAILGHELGHYKLGHIKKGLLSSLVFGFIGFYLLSEILQSDNFFLDHGLENLTIYSKFLLFYLVIGSYTFFTKPFTSALSRKREFEADDFSFQYTSGEYMISGLLKLSKDNASNLTPDPLYSSYYYSHPPIAERVQSIEKKLSQTGKKGN